MWVLRGVHTLDDAKRRCGDSAIGKYFVYVLSPELFLLGFFSLELEEVLSVDLLDVFSEDDFSLEDLAESELLEEPSAAADFL